ncbi:hypothetical protein ACU8WE_16845 [Pseudomonas parakoreensis]
MAEAVAVLCGAARFGSYCFGVLVVRNAGFLPETGVTPSLASQLPQELH